VAHVPAVERAVLVLRALGNDDRGRRLSELSRELGLSKSTLFGLLSTLERYGLVEVRQWFFEVWNEPNLECFWQRQAGRIFRTLSLHS